MKNVLEENVTYTSDAQTKAKVYYRSCLDKNETIEKLTSRPMFDFIELVCNQKTKNNKKLPVLIIQKF